MDNHPTHPTVMAFLPSNSGWKKRNPLHHLSHLSHLILSPCLSSLHFEGEKFPHPILGISNPTRTSVGFKRAKRKKTNQSPWFQVPQALSGKSPSRVPTTCSTRLLLGFVFFLDLVHWKTTRKTLVRGPPPSTYVDTNSNRKVCALTLLPMALQHQRKIIACESC